MPGPVRKSRASARLTIAKKAAVKAKATPTKTSSGVDAAPRRRPGRPAKPKPAKEEEEKEKVYDDSVMPILQALKFQNIKNLKGGNKDIREATREMIKRLHVFQERIAKGVADGTIQLAKLRALKGDTYDVEELLNAHKINGVIMYLVLYKDFPIEDASWEPLSNINNFSVQEFYERFPGKPGKALADAEFAAEENAAAATKSAVKVKKSVKGKGAIGMAAPTPADEAEEEEQANIEGNYEDDLASEQLVVEA